MPKIAVSILSTPSWSGRRNLASLKLMLDDEAARRATRPRLSSMRLPPDVTPPPQVLTDAVPGRDQAFQPARDELARLGDQLRRTTAAADESFGRLGKLKRLEAARRQWTAEHNLVLPGEASGIGGLRTPMSRGGHPSVPQLPLQRLVPRRRKPAETRWVSSAVCG